LSLISFIVAVAGFRATSVGNDVNDENRTKKMRHELRWFVSLLGFRDVRRDVIPRLVRCDEIRTGAPYLKDKAKHADNQCVR
jgi:hypothetical protein